MYLHVGAQAWNMEHWRDEHKAQKSVKKVYLSTDELYLSTDSYSHSKTELRFASLSVSVDRCNVPVDRYTQTTQDRAQVFYSWVHLSTDASAPVDRRRKHKILSFQIRPHLGVSFLHDPHLYLTLYKHPFGAKFAESSLPSKSLQGTKRKSPKLLLCFNFPPRSSWNHHLCGAEAGSSSIQPSTSINLHPIEVWRAFGRSTRRIPTGFVP